GQLFKPLLPYDANGPLVQEVTAKRGRRVVARDRGIRRDRDGGRPIVLDLVANGEQVFVVHRNRPREYQALTVLPGQPHRPLDAERVGPDLLPDRLRRRYG